MKVLQVNCVYPTGSTGKIVHEIHKGLQSGGFESVVCYGRGENVNQPNVYKTCSDAYAKLNNGLSRITGIPYGGCQSATKKLISIIKNEKPDVVHLHCINNHFVNIYRLVQWLKENHIKTVVTNHAEFFYTGNCSHAFECDKWMTGCGNCADIKRAAKSILFDKTAKSYQMMKDAFAGFGDNVVIVSASSWGEKRSKKSKIMEGLKHATVLNGVDVEVFRYRPEEDVYGKDRKLGKKIVFHVTAHFTDRPDHAKGGWAVLELARQMADQPVMFYVAASRSELECPLPDNVVLVGSIKDQKTLASYYAGADLTLITSKRETFSMPCAESLCCGTPVVGFEAGAPEKISIPEYSEFVAYGDLDNLQEAVCRWIDREDIDKQLVSEEAVTVYSNKQMVDSYMKIYGDLG